ncbi:MAG: hypothetical protein ACKVOM_10150 [Ferruginibacter sp.]
MKKLLSPVFLMFLSSDTFAQNENYKTDSLVIKMLADEIMVNSTVYKNLRYLCKEIGPRLSGSASAEKAVYATKKMLIDAAADTLYLQPCKVPQKKKAFFL